MQGFYGGLKSEQNSLSDKQTTNIGRAAREGNLVDGQTTILQCSNCNKELCEIKVTRPKANIKSFVVAECCHCGDKSFKQEIIGGFIIGGTEETSVVGYPMDTETDDKYFIQKITIKTKKRR